MSILETSSFKSMISTMHDMWGKGWNEMSGGNISFRIDYEEVKPFIKTDKIIQKYKFLTALPELSNQLFLVKGTGKYFRTISKKPERDLGLIKISSLGDECYLLWGFCDGSSPTSELPSHLISHKVRQQVSNGQDRVIMHCHAANLIALSFILDLKAEVITRALWETITECSIFFPEGIGVLPWMVAGTDEIGLLTAKLMEKHRLVLWAQHGIFAAGKDLNEAFGLIETAEKAAEVLIKVISMGKAKRCITKENLISMAKHLDLDLYKDALKIDSVVTKINKF